MILGCSTGVAGLPFSQLWSVKCAGEVERAKAKPGLVSVDSSARTGLVRVVFFLSLITMLHLLRWRRVVKRQRRRCLLCLRSRGNLQRLNKASLDLLYLENLGLYLSRRRNAKANRFGLAIERKGRKRMRSCTPE